MVIKAFPPVNSASPEGILAIGGDLAPESLILAYRNGIFPWPFSDDELVWFAPPKRAILLLEKLHISTSLAKFLRKNPFRITFNQSFREVMLGCQEMVNRSGQDGTWIIDDMLDAYCELHDQRLAQSIEVWKDEVLVGGIYGVTIGGTFAGESMFYRHPNASKVGLIKLADRLRECGVTWIDCQVMTPHMKSFGAGNIKRERYMELLREGMARPGFDLADLD